MGKLLHIDNRLLRQDGRILMESDSIIPDIDLSGKNWFTLTYKLDDSILENTNYWDLPVVSVADGTTVEIYIAPKHQHDNMGFTENINLTEENRVQSYNGDTGIDLKYVNMGFVFDSQSEFIGLNWTGYLTFTVAFDGDLTTSDELISLFGGYDTDFGDYFSDSVAVGYGDNQSYIHGNGGPGKFTYAQPYYIDFGNFNYKTTWYNNQPGSNITFHNIFLFIGNEFLSGIQLGRVFDIYERFDMSGYFANIGICNENGCYINWYEDEHGNRFWLDYNGVNTYLFMFANSRIYPEFYNQFSQHYYPNHFEFLPNGATGRRYYELDKIYLANAHVYNDGWELTADPHDAPNRKSRDVRFDEVASYVVDGFNSPNLDNSYLHFMDQEDEYGIYVHGGYFAGNMYALSGNYYGGWDLQIDFYGYLLEAKGFDMSGGNSLGNIFFRPSLIWRIGDMSYAMEGSNVSHLDMRVDKLMFDKYDELHCYENPYYNTLNAYMTFFTHAIENNQDYLFMATNFYIDNRCPEYYYNMISPSTSDCTLYMLNTYFHDNGGELASNVYDYRSWPADYSCGYLVINPDIVGTGFENELRWISEYYKYDMGDASLYPYPYSNKSSTAYWKKCFDELNWTTETDPAFEYEYIES